MKRTFNHNLIWILGLVILTLIIEYIVFGVVLIHPNDYMIMDNTDGRQIYFNIAHYVKYGSAGRLTNQNYPFGESIFMTDAQASIAILLNFFNHYITKIDTLTVGFVNGIILYSIPLCSIFMFLNFRYFRIDKYLSFIAAILITFLSPQILRITCGHYGLTYLFFFPMVIYLLLRILNKDSKPIFFALSCFSLLVFFGLNNGHMSLAGSLFVFVFGFWSIFLIKQTGLKRFIPISIAFSALFFFGLFHKFTDIAHDREQYPWGFIYYLAQFESVFLPAQGKLLEFYQSLLPLKIAEIKEEGFSYIGLIGFLASIFTVLRFIFNLFKGRLVKLFFPTCNVQINVLYLSGIVILLYSFGLPFIIPGCEDLLEYIPMIRQFRAPGRFAWIFYYSFSIYTIYLLHLLIRRFKLRNNIVAYVILTNFIIVAYVFDIHNVYKWNFRFIDTSKYFPNIFHETHRNESFYKTYSIDTNNFSSVYGIPMINQWNAKIVPEDEFYILISKLLNITYFTKIPWITSKLSRVSTYESLTTAQFVSSELVKKEIFEKMDTKRNILIIQLKSYSLKDPEKYLLSKSTKLHEDELYAYYSFNVKNGYLAQRESMLTNFDSLARTYLRDVNTAINESTLFKKYYQLDSSELAISEPNEFILILDTLVHPSSIDSVMELSLWSQVDYKTDGSPKVRITRSDTSNNLLEMKDIVVANGTDIQHRKIRVNYLFNLKSEKQRVQLYLHPGRNHKFERLLIKPKELQLFEKLGNHKLYNGFVLDY